MLAAGHFAASAGVINISGLAWTTATTSGDGTLGGLRGNATLVGGTLTLVGPDTGSIPLSNTEVTVTRTFAQAGQLSFSYLGSTADASWADLGGDTNDGNRFDKVGYRVDAFETTLSPNDTFGVTAAPVSGGPVVLNLVAGQSVTFFVNSFDELNGAATLEISNLTFTPVPEPASLAVIAGAGLVGFAAWRRRSVSTR